VRWEWIEENPALSASPPAVSAGYAGPPDAGEAVRLLAVAQERSGVMAVMTWLARVAGARRGELCALRGNIDEHGGDLLIGGGHD
jgi:hypothetical protein